MAEMFAEEFIMKVHVYCSTQTQNYYTKFWSHSSCRWVHCTFYRFMHNIVAWIISVFS